MTSGTSSPSGTFTGPLAATRASIQTVRGLCTDEATHVEIDQALAAILDFGRNAVTQPASQHRFRVWQTTTHDGHVAHAGTVPTGQDVTDKVALSDRTNKAGAPHTVEYREIERIVEITTTYSDWTPA